ncbi:ISL3 family transposase [Streptosporangium sp. NPDC002721]|uniref:ISL3 family transposase n=1 Tax=Streptosporangium sp. NPDC002721 TaxID=3366188 RepID=UPI00369938FD
MASWPLCEDLLYLLFPHLEKVLVEQVCRMEGAVWISARTRSDTALACPDCRALSQRVHSRYRRKVADTAVGGQPVVIELSVRRLFCDTPDCRRRTFAEQVEGLTVRYARYTPCLLGVLRAAGLALAGRAGARLTAALAAMVSRVTLLSLVMALPDPVTSTPRVLGVDDFAFRRGQVYGTVLIDCLTHKPVDLLPDRRGDTFAAWLSTHPGAEVICRDRAEAYGEAASAGAPAAIQVADRWHLWHNLAEAVERCVRQHQRCLPEPDEPIPDLLPTPATQMRLAGQVVAPADPEGRYADRTRDQHAAVQILREQGYGLRATARHLGITVRRVRQLVRAATWQELVENRWQGRYYLLDPYKEYLHRRWQEGCTNLVRLHAEITEMGYPGSYNSLCTYFRRFRQVKGRTPAQPAPPSAREVTAWLTRHPDALKEIEKQQLKTVLARCPELKAVSGHVRAFAGILTDLAADQLPGWLAAVLADDLPGLHSFVHGIERDLAAVTAGLSLPWSSAAVEGQVNRIKTLKRQMFGRAGFLLLRKRVLLA